MKKPLFRCKILYVSVRIMGNIVNIEDMLTVVRCIQIVFQLPWTYFERLQPENQPLAVAANRIEFNQGTPKQRLSRTWHFEGGVMSGSILLCHWRLRICFHLWTSQVKQALTEHVNRLRLILSDLHIQPMGISQQSISRIAQIQVQHTSHIEFQNQHNLYIDMVFYGILLKLHAVIQCDHLDSTRAACMVWRRLHPHVWGTLVGSHVFVALEAELS